VKAFYEKAHSHQPALTVRTFPRPTYVSPEAIPDCRGLAHQQSEVLTGCLSAEIGRKALLFLAHRQV
jgi:hypothetical protein